MIAFLLVAFCYRFVFHHREASRGCDCVAVVLLLHRCRQIVLSSVFVKIITWKQPIFQLLLAAVGVLICLFGLEFMCFLWFCFGPTAFHL